MTLPVRRVVIILLLMLPSWAARAQVTASFITDVNSGCSPLVVHFTNTTGSCSSCTYSWDFGNGDPTDPSAGPVSTSYSGAGSYTATLTVNDGGVITTYSETITVFPNPTVSFTASNTSVCPGAPITFTSTTVGGVPGPVTYTWSFGDGGVSTANSPEHSYGTPGAYSVTLFATNSDGCQSSLEQTNYITVLNPPVASFSAPTTYFCNPPGDVTFFNSSSGAPPLSYSWTFGDGSPGSTATAPGHDYTSSGDYTVKLVVTDGNGCEDSITLNDYIIVANITPAFAGPDSACVNSRVSFSNTSTPMSSISGSTWTFGDGSAPEYATDGSHTYTTPGTYTVTLVVSTGECSDTVRHTIVILPGPATSLTINPTHPCPPPTTVSFTGSAPAGTLITWLDSDTATTIGLTGTGDTFSHTYSTAGVYSIKMIATNPLTGCTDTIGASDTLYDLYLNASASPQDGCVPLTVTLGADVSTIQPYYPYFPEAYPYGVSSYTWNFGDGSAGGSGASPTHTYTAVGVYTATVTAITTNGCPISSTVQIWVGKPPQMTVIDTPRLKCYHDNEITFLGDTIIGPANWFVWEFGDGTSEADSVDTVTHHYVIPGTFTATVTPYYNGCPGPAFVTVDTVVIDSPRAVLADRILCSPPGEVIFGDSSMGDTHPPVWLFGDGTTSTLTDPVHTYSLPTTYTVTLAVYNATSGCTDTEQIVLNLARPIPNFTVTDTALCRGESATFISSITGGTASDYLWYQNGVREATGVASYIDTFTVAGFYTTMLIIQDQNGCLDTASKPNYIEVAQPDPNFTASPETGCLPLTATFTDHSTDVTGMSLTSYIWTFGDGAPYTTTTSGSIAHTFTTSGTFTTKEVVTDALGCKDSVSLPLVTVYNPVASFIASNLNPCVNAPVTFTSTSTGTITSYLWVFGDGSTSTLSTAVHSYTATGLYTVQLVVTDPHGCTDTATYRGYINANRPVAAFTMSDSFSICPPLDVNFINTSTGAAYYYWTLGDGTTSGLVSPSDLYLTEGAYRIMLVATNMYGCADTAYGDATIFGYAGAFSYTPDSGCDPLTVHFTATIANVPSVVWDFADGTTSSVSGADTISHTYTLPGAYVPKLILSDNTGCSASSPGADTIKIDAVYPGFTENPNPVCLGEAFSFVDTSHSYWSTIVTTDWTFNGDTSTLSAPSFAVDSIGSYPASLTVTDGWGCIATITGTVNVFPPPIITASPDTIICVGDSATLIGYGGSSYVWSPPGTLSCTSCNPAFANPETPTTYTVTGTDIHGCSNTDTTSVYLKTKTTSIAYRDTSICLGTIVQLFDSGATKFSWSPSAGLSSTYVADPFAQPLETTRYTVVAQLGRCQPDTNTVMVTVYPLPTVTTNPDQTVVSGTQVQLTARGNNIASYLWDNGSILSCDTCPAPVVTVSVTSHFDVTVTSEFGCTASDSTTIYVICDQSQIFIPNAFTPNGDGQDDIFYPRGHGVSIIKSFRIYNRWGELIFERDGIQLNDASNAWDGTYNGNAPKPDVYVYILDAVCETGAPIDIKGNVTIIR